MGRVRFGVAMRARCFAHGSGPLLRILRGTFGEQRRYAIDETYGILHRIVSFSHGNVSFSHSNDGTRPYAIITDFLQLVGVCQKTQEGSVDLRLRSLQPSKFRAKA